MTARKESSPMQPSRRHPELLLMILLGIGIISIAIGAQVWRDGLPVHGVRIDGTRIVPDAEIFHLASVPMDKQLYDVDLAAVRNRVRRSPYVNDVAVHRDPPDRILIEIDERIPIALVAVGQMFYVDTGGVLMPVIRSEAAFDLPVLTGVENVTTCEPGKRLSDPAVCEALRLIRAAQQLDEALYRRISEVHIAPTGELSLYTTDAGVPVLVGRGDITTKLEKFEAFWSTVVSRRGAQALTSVDLRFADQVVVRWAANDEQMAN
jgi:cell division protein FtsQ